MIEYNMYGFQCDTFYSDTVVPLVSILIPNNISH